MSKYVSFFLQSPLKGESYECILLKPFKKLPNLKAKMQTNFRKH